MSGVEFCMKLLCPFDSTHFHFSYETPSLPKILKIYIYISIFAFLVHMLFTNHRKNVIHASNTSFPLYRQAVSLPTKPTPPPPPPVEPVLPAKKPMKWGEPTWFFFHTLAEKIKPEHFDESKHEIFEIIKNVCATLPCPNCAQHASEYMQKIYFQNIRTKEDLQIMLWTFHNEVNKRKGFAHFPIEELQTKYKTAMTRNIIQHFLYHHEDKHASFRMIADDYFRSRVSANLRIWFIKHIHIFNE